jgi:hypothetical protein
MKNVDLKEAKKIVLLLKTFLPPLTPKGECANDNAVILFFGFF